MTNEQISELKLTVKGAPDGATKCATYIDTMYFKPAIPHGLKLYSPFTDNWQWVHDCSMLRDLHDVSDLRVILAQHEEIEQLKADLKIAMKVVDGVVQAAIEVSDLNAGDLQEWLVKEGVLKTVPFDPTKHYDYTHETQDGQDWVTWSDWYEEKREQGNEQ